MRDLQTLALLGFSLIFCVFKSDAAIVVGSSSNTTMSNTNTRTLAFATQAGVDRILLVGVSIQQPTNAVTSITYNNVGLTKLNHVANASQSRVEIWYMLAPPVGTFNLVVNTSATGNTVFGVQSYSGVDQTTPFGTFVSASNTGTSATVTASSATGELVYGVVSWNNGTLNTIGAGQTEYWDVSVNSSISGAGSTEAGATSTAISWTNASSSPWSIAAVPMRPAPVTNPGGVPGASIWLKANTGVTTGATFTWADNSGNNRNGVQTIATNQPTLNPNLINFNPALVLDGTNDYLVLQNLAGLPTGAAQVEAFAVAQHLNSTSNWNHVISYGGAGANQYFTLGKHQGTANAISAFNTSDAISTALEYANGAVGLTNGKYTGTQGVISSFGRQRATITFANNKLTTTGYIGVDPALILTTCWNGNIAETIIFPTNLNATQNLQVNSYLALKYGVTLDQTTAQNYLASDGTTIYWNGTTNSGYKNNIAGIVRDDASALSQKQSRTVNIASDANLITMGLGTIAANNAANTNTFAADRSALVWGDNAAANAWQWAESPSSRMRISREWKVQETGTVGTVLLRVPDNFAPSGAKLPSPTNAAMYLLVDADGDFSAGATEVLMTSNGTNWEINYDFSNGQFFTFATGLPVAPGCASSNMQLWFAGNGGVVWNGSNQVLNWNNQVGYSPVSTVNPTGTNPTYVPVGLNFNPTVSFTGGTQALRATVNPLSGVMSSQANEVFVVSTNVTTGVALNIGINDNPRFEVGLDPTSFRLDFPTFANARTTFSSATYPGIYSIYSTPNGGGTIHTGRLNGTQIGTGSSTISATTTGSGYVTIGGNDGAIPSFVMNGQIAEILFFNGNLTATDREKIETYLAIKYGMTLGHNYVSGTGTIWWNTTTNAGYNNRITGIGREDCQSLFQKQSKSVSAGAIVTLGLGQIAASNQTNIYSFPQNPQGLIIGDDNGSTNILRTNQPLGTCGRMTRIWKVAEVATDIGNMAVQFDLSTLSAIYGSFPASNISLIVNNTTNFSTVLRSYTATSYTSGVASFSNVNLANNEFFTIAVKDAGFATSISSNAPVCDGSQLQLMATGGTTYAWSGPGGFTSSLQNPTLSAVSFSASGTYSVTISNGFGCSEIRTIAVTVQSCNPNICVINTCRNIATVGSITGTDADGDPLTYTIVQNASHGTFTRIGNAFIYSPTTNYTGEDQVIIRTCDNSNACVDCIKNFVIAPCSSPPICGSNNSLTVCKGIAKQGIFNATDPGGAALTYTIQQQPSSGTVTVSGSTYTYTPVAGFEGSVSFVYRVSNGTLSTDCTIAVYVENCFQECDGSGCGSNLITGGSYNSGGSGLRLFIQNSVAVSANTQYCYSLSLTNNCPACVTTAKVSFYANSVLIGEVPYDNLPLNTAAIKGFVFNTAQLGNPATINFEVVHTDFGTPGTTIVAATASVKAITGAGVPTANADNGITICRNSGAYTASVLNNDLNVQPGAVLTIVTGVAPATGTATISGNNIIFTPAVAFVGTANITYQICNGSCCDQAILSISVIDPTVTISGTTVCTGGNYTFVPVIAGIDTSGATYQWQSSPNNSTWTNISGATYTSYNTGAMAANTYYSLVMTPLSGGCSPINAVSALVTVNNDPTVSVNAAASAVCIGGSTTLTATTAGGAGTCTYQWQNSPDNSTWTDIPGATNSNYTTPALSTPLYHRVIYACNGSGCCN